MNIQTALPSASSSSSSSSSDVIIKPTRETYDRLQQAYDHFNKALFEGTLPNALFTFHRRKGSYGYFAAAKFQWDDGKAADEIALNPARFHDRPIKETLSTIVHEMVHLWQHHHGEPGRGRYHNAEWAEKMRAIGLQPADTGEEGGKETGERVDHFIIENGPFDTAAGKLIAKDFMIVWKEVPGLATSAKGDGEAQPSTNPKGGKRVRYCCPDCDLKGLGAS
ncbi:SprT-like domain-containing protein [Reyranella soli]|uniref:Peptidase n=1 Tax=Reyranella soli TaxID=1230389 RepID=A0A512NNA3_9HYPH|nr:SprT-like domain-containing protein [Reyranella soli]GEP60433.1 peptidase [Reyranella soli]